MSSCLSLKHLSQWLNRSLFASRSGTSALMFSRVLFFQISSISRDDKRFVQVA